MPKKSERVCWKLGKKSIAHFYKEEDDAEMDTVFLIWICMCPCAP